MITVPGKRLDRLLQRLARRDVQVVGRLVEEQHVGRPEQQLGQRHPALLAAREHPDLLLDIGLREQEAAQQRPDPLDRPTAGACASASSRTVRLSSRVCDWSWA